MDKPSKLIAKFKVSTSSQNGFLGSKKTSKSSSKGVPTRAEQLTKDLFVNVHEIFADGSHHRLRLKAVELVKYLASPPQDGQTSFKRAVSCFRDLMVFLSHLKFPGEHGQGHGHWDSATEGNENIHLPSILPRSGMGFFLIDFFHLKIICWPDRCLVLDYNQTERFEHDPLWQRNCKASQISNAVFVEAFVGSLCKHLQKNFDKVSQTSWQRDVIREVARSRSRTNLSKSGEQDDGFSTSGSLLSGLASFSEEVPFEMVVLDTVLKVTTEKFNRNLSSMKEVFNRLLDVTLANPSDTMLEKILAFKKSLLSFETSVVSIKKAVESMLDNDLDMADLYLSQDREVSDHEEVELLLEGYRSDIIEVHLEIRSMRAQLDDTRMFIDTHLNEVRNRIIRMNLFMEMVTLGVTFAACASSIFGMNLNSHIQEHPYAFYATTSTILSTSVIIICFCMYRLSSISHSRRAKDYPILKDILKYLDTFDLFRGLESKRPTTKAKLLEILSRLQKDAEISQDELNLILPVLEQERARDLNLAEFQSIMTLISGPA